MIVSNEISRIRPTGQTLNLYLRRGCSRPSSQTWSRTKLHAVSDGREWSVTVACWCDYWLVCVCMRRVVGAGRGRVMEVGQAYWCGFGGMVRSQTWRWRLLTEMLLRRRQRRSTDVAGQLWQVLTPRRVSSPRTPQLGFDFERRAGIKRHDWAVEAGRRRRRCAAGVRARHSCDGRPVYSLEVNGRSSTCHSTTCKSLSSRQLWAATSTSSLQRVLSLSLHVRLVRHLLLREYFQHSSYHTEIKI